MVVYYLMEQVCTISFCRMYFNILQILYCIQLDKLRIKYVNGYMLSIKLITYVKLTYVKLSSLSNNNL